MPLCYAAHLVDNSNVVTSGEKFSPLLFLPVHTQAPLCLGLAAEALNRPPLPIAHHPPTPLHPRSRFHPSQYYGWTPAEFLSTLIHSFSRFFFSALFSFFSLSKVFYCSSGTHLGGVCAHWSGTGGHYTMVVSSLILALHSAA